MAFAATTISHRDQRYETAGDWVESLPASIVFSANFLHITVSALGNDDYEFLVQLHEVVEAYLCKKRGISQADVDKFDMEYEANRVEGDMSESGDSKDAPYYWEHQAASKIERMMAKELDVNWDEYEAAIDAL